jgi:hypothetical protein
VGSVVRGGDFRGVGDLACGIGLGGVRDAYPLSGLKAAGPPPRGDVKKLRLRLILSGAKTSPMALRAPCYVPLLVV